VHIEGHQLTKLRLKVNITNVIQYDPPLRPQQAPASSTSDQHNNALQSLDTLLVAIIST